MQGVGWVWVKALTASLAAAVLTAWWFLILYEPCSGGRDWSLPIVVAATSAALPLMATVPGSFLVAQYFINMIAVIAATALTVGLTVLTEEPHAECELFLGWTGFYTRVLWGGVTAIVGAAPIALSVIFLRLAGRAR